MSAIKNIKLYNFKAFYDETTIELNDKHLLLFGENGSGKSSIYWALHTLLQSSTKEVADIEKYFDPTNDENLINTTLIEKLTTVDTDTLDLIFPTSISNNSSVEVELMDGNLFKLTPKGIEATDLDYLKNLNRRSDFISHRLLINFYNFRNSKKINLWEVFVRDIFPFVKNNRNTGNISLSDVLKSLETSMPFRFDGDYFRLIKSSQQQNAFIARVNQFNDDIDYWLGRINTLVNDFYLKHFEPLYKENIKISLIYSAHDRLSFSKIHPQFYKNHERWYNYVGFTQPSIRLKIEKKNKFGEYIEVSRPQSYFNEAKLTSIALSVRFCLLDDTIRPTFEGKILALDDLLVSLDMGNRDKILDILLNEYAQKYKIYLLTHERNFFDFCLYKIQQYSQKDNWSIQEIYEPIDIASTPTIIPSDYSYFDKAVKYFKTKDFVATSLYLRKDFEKTVKERLPKEYTKTVDGEYHNLSHYWKLFREHYKNLGMDMDNINPNMNKDFDQSKTFILNRQAHHNLSEPVYTFELKKVFELLANIKLLFPIPETTIFLSKDMFLKFKHPNENYSIEFKLVNDFRVDKIGVNSAINIPDCNILTWQYKDVEFWDFDKGIKMTIPHKITENKLNYIVDSLIENIRVPLNITYEMFYENTLLVGGLWSLKDIFDKSQVAI